MEKIRTIVHKGKSILFIDLSNSSAEEAIQIMQDSRMAFEQAAPGSLLALDFVENARFNSDAVDELKNWTLHNKPYVKAVAVVGLSTLQTIVMQAASKFSGRSFNPFKDLDTAKDWLVSQK
jgi:hypothetical protein